LLRQERKELAPLDCASIPIAKGKVGSTIPAFLMAFIKVHFFIYNQFSFFFRDDWGWFGITFESDSSFKSKKQPKPTLSLTNKKLLPPTLELSKEPPSRKKGNIIYSGISSVNREPNKNTDTQ
jgi:hypothetical protein